MVFMLYSHLQTVQSYFNRPNNIRRNVNMLTGSPERRELFKIFTDLKPLKSWIVSKDLLFLLLQKKERTLLEKLFRSSLFLINQVDENGNNPLLYICLKNRGCRH
jgi:ankyrin repeat protein